MIRLKFKRGFEALGTREYASTALVQTLGVSIEIVERAGLISELHILPTGVSERMFMKAARKEFFLAVMVGKRMNCASFDDVFKVVKKKKGE